MYPYCCGGTDKVGPYRRVAARSDPVRDAPTNTANRVVLCHALQTFYSGVKSAASRFLINVGLRVKEEREKRGLTQERLAEFAGTDTRALQRVESGAASTGLIRLYEIAVALGLEPHALLTKPDPRTKRRAGRPRKLR